MEQTEAGARAAAARAADQMSAHSDESPSHGGNGAPFDASQIATGDVVTIGRPLPTLDRATFFLRASQRRIRVDLPELGEGMHVYVRALTASEAQGGLEKMAKDMGLDPNDSALTVALCTVTPDGAAMFTVPDDLPALRSLDVAVFSAIYKAIVKQSGVTQADVEAAAKN